MVRPSLATMKTPTPPRTGGGVAAFGGSGGSDGAGDHSGGLDEAFLVLAVHLFQDDRVPARLALLSGHVVHAGPAPQAQLLDEVHVCEYTTGHGDPLPNGTCEVTAPDSGDTGNIST